MRRFFLLPMNVTVAYSGGTGGVAGVARFKHGTKQLSFDEVHRYILRS